MTIDTQQTTQVPTGTWTIDPSHSEVGFTVRHLMTKVRGQFETFEGSITTTDAVHGFRAEATIDLNSVNTRDTSRDGHLRSADFFDVENSGPMTFTTTSFDGSTARGDLTIKGVTNPVELDVEFLGVENDAYGNTRIGYEASTEISRKAWGVNFNVPLDGGKVLVGDKVAIVLSVQAVLAQ
ncbi:MAG: YceI family protein [Nocardioidaceae bacterium]|nr:YceI family protein [Nocardioidaceae bacterium]